MFDDKEVLGAISSRFNEKKGQYTSKDRAILEAEAHIEAMIEFNMIDINKMHDYWINIITESSELAYFMGLQEGAKLIHTLISGNCVDEVMKMWGVFTEEDCLLKANINSFYSNKSKGIKNYCE